MSTIKRVKHKYGIKAMDKTTGAMFVVLTDELNEEFRKLHDSNCEVVEWWKI